MGSLVGAKIAATGKFNVCLVSSWKVNYVISIYRSPNINF